MQDHIRDAKVNVRNDFQQYSID